MDPNKPRPQNASQLDQLGEQEQEHRPQPDSQQQHVQQRSPHPRGNVSQSPFGSAVYNNDRPLDKDLHEASSRAQLLRGQIRQYEPVVQKLSQQLAAAKGTPQESQLLVKHIQAANKLQKKKREFAKMMNEVSEILKQLRIRREEQERHRRHQETQQRQSPFQPAIPSGQPHTSPVRTSFLASDLTFPISDSRSDESQDEATNRTANLRREIFQYGTLINELSPQLISAKGTPQEPYLRARHTDAMIELEKRRARLHKMTGEIESWPPPTSIYPTNISQAPLNPAVQPQIKNFPITMNERMANIDELRSQIGQCESLVQTLSHRQTKSKGTPQEAALLVARHREATNDLRSKRVRLEKMVAEVEEIRRLPTQTQLHLYRSHLQHQLGQYGIEASSIQPLQTTPTPCPGPLPTSSIGPPPTPSLGPPARLRLHQGPHENTYDFILLPSSVPLIIPQQPQQSGTTGSLDPAQLQAMQRGGDIKNKESETEQKYTYNA